MCFPIVYDYIHKYFLDIVIVKSITPFDSDYLHLSYWVDES